MICKVKTRTQRSHMFKALFSSKEREQNQFNWISQSQ